MLSPYYRSAQQYPSQYDAQQYLSQYEAQQYLFQYDAQQYLPNYDAQQHPSQCDDEQYPPQYDAQQYPFQYEAQQYPSQCEAQQYSGPAAPLQNGFYRQGQQHVSPGDPFQLGFHDVTQQQGGLLGTLPPRFPTHAHGYGGPSTHRGFNQQATVYGPLPGTLQSGSHQQSQAYGSHPAVVSYVQHEQPQQGGLPPGSPQDNVAPAPQHRQSACVTSFHDIGWISDKPTLESARDIEVSTMPKREQEISTAKAKAFIKEVKNSRRRSSKNDPYPSEWYGGLTNFWNGPQGWFTLGPRGREVYIRPEDRKKGAKVEKERAPATAAAGKKKKRAVGPGKAPRSATLGRSLEPPAVASGSAAAPGKSPTPEGLSVDERNSDPSSTTLDRSTSLPPLRSPTPGRDTWHEGTIFGEGDDDSGLAALGLWMETSRNGLPVVDPRSPTLDMETRPEYESQVFFCNGD